MKNEIVAILLFTCMHSSAQMTITNRGSLQLHPGASLNISGSLDNKISANLINNGSMYITGNINNDQAAMNAGAGTLFLNGSLLQTVSGSEVFKTNSLVTNNTAGFILNNNLSVSGAHVFQNGLISTSSTPNYLIYEAGSSYSGNNDARHVTGWTKKLGNTNFIFPVGDNTWERPIEISSLTAISEINCHYYTATQNIFNLTAPLVNVDPNEFWRIDKVSGGNAKIRLNWNQSKVPMANVLLQDVLTGFYTGTSWTDAGGAGTAIGTVATTGNVLSASTGNFGLFTFGFTSFPVPLKLISFSGARRKGVSILEWLTENEDNVDHFDVQRSDNDAIFKTIGHVKALNHSYGQRYIYNDTFSLDGTAFYRIKCIDHDGKFFYSKIISLTDNHYPNTAFYVVNPVKDVISIYSTNANNGLFHYRLYTASGQLLSEGELNMAGTTQSIKRPFGALAGIYTLEINDLHSHFSKKLKFE
jgi:hypothetical protein